MKKEQDFPLLLRLQRAHSAGVASGRSSPGSNSHRLASSPAVQLPHCRQVPACNLSGQEKLAPCWHMEMTSEDTCYTGLHANGLLEFHLPAIGCSRL